MATHYDEKCRRCSCRRKACQRRRAQHRRQVKCLFPNAQFLLVPSAGALFRRQYPIAVNHNAPPFEIEGGDEIAIDSEDLKVMRESVDTMRKQLRRGLRDIEEIRNLIKRVVAQRDAEKRELSLRGTNGEK